MRIILFSNECLLANEGDGRFCFNVTIWLSNSPVTSEKKVEDILRFRRISFSRYGGQIIKCKVDNPVTLYKLPDFRAWQEIL
jgi:hypothetical protein